MSFGMAFFETEEDRNHAAKVAEQEQVIVINLVRVPEDVPNERYAGKYSILFKSMEKTMPLFTELGAIGIFELREVPRS